MSTVDLKLYCAECKQEPVPTGRTDIWRCPNCGKEDVAAAIIEDGKAHAVEVARRGFNDDVASIAKKSRFMTFKPGTIEARSYRWISDLDYSQI